MKGFVTNIEEIARGNKYFRQVLYTSMQMQLVVMSLKPGEEIGEEVHQLDQFIKVESGTGISIVDGVEHELHDADALVIPKGARHNIINTATDAPMKLYTVYAPPNHKDGTVHKTKADAEADESEHFDGVTSM